MEGGDIPLFLEPGPVIFPVGSGERKTGEVQEVKDLQNNVEIDDLARFAVDEQIKKQNKVIEFKKVVNAKEQVVAGTIYYLTLEVVENGKKKIYEAKVWVKPWMNFKEVLEFKPVDGSDKQG